MHLQYYLYCHSYQFKCGIIQQAFAKYPIGENWQVDRFRAILVSRWERIFVVFSVFAAVAFFAVAIGLRIPGPPFRIGINPWLGYEPLLVARDALALDPKIVRVVDMSSTTETIRALQNGILDAAALTLDEALLLKHSGTQIRVLLVADISNGADAVVINPRATEALSVQGARIAFEGKAMGAYMAARMIEKMSLHPNDVKLIEAPIDRQERLYVSGEVDGVITFDPIRTKLLSLGARQIFSSRDIPNEVLDVLVVRDQSLDSNPAAIRHLRDAWEFGRKKLVALDPALAAGVTKRTGLSEPELRAALKDIAFPNAEESETLILGSGQRLAETSLKLWQIMQRYGISPSGAPTPMISGEVHR
ncbi:ABC transporter substrate-binding protein [Magnetospirillum sp. LM-5]|uniref:ABC transporter substrate-binding protein n=1 Tax=Magnetospirillum sp. LM-5 TaxID=2681466 RepID=UPI00156E511A|nr:ABC transporter substrate-binding protein [Magnetospirillum sp. LM-5]